jgi:ABC-2 type transport system permease protein
MNMFKKEFSMKLKSIASWAIPIVALIFAFMSLYPAFSKDAGLLDEALAAMPPELLAAFGMTNINLGTVAGYTGFVFLFIQICLAIQASNYGFGLVSIEERELTADFLLAKPVSRTQILTSKLLAALVALTITNLAIWLTTLLVINLFNAGNEYQLTPFLWLLASILPFQLFFLAVGMFISLLVKRVRSVTPLSMALAFGMYMLVAFGDMLGKDSLELISPFRHFDTSTILSTGGFDTPLALANIVVSILAIVGSYFLYKRRNIRSAI